ncbi:hypothetical protein ACQ86N_26615 [Puia sp. P3]|uniref:hypothetical protein n=1 Tax=Puia sp. P3 TaxID=3423952 RepID=UPI003D66C94C
MKKRLLLIAGLFLARLTVFANAEKLAVLRSGGSGDYWEDTPGNILPSNPCTGFEFRITFTFPSGYTGVKEFDWYANNTLVKTTTQVSYDAGSNPYGETPMLVTAENTKIVCKVIYKNARRRYVVSLRLRRIPPSGQTPEPPDQRPRRRRRAGPRRFLVSCHRLIE